MKFSKYLNARRLMIRLGLVVLLFKPGRSSLGYRRPAWVVRIPRAVLFVLRPNGQPARAEDLPGTNLVGWGLMLWLGWEAQYRTDREWPPGY